jgi:PTS system mannose-specific IIA component
VIKIIVIAHCSLARELVKSVQAISGKQSNLYSIEQDLNDSLEEMKLRIETALKDIDNKDGVLLLVDMFGGTPCNASAHHICTDLKVEIISGVNLPMIISAVIFSQTDISLSELANKVLDRGQKSIINIRNALRNHQSAN